MRIVITGGAGFLGQKLAASLAARGVLSGRAIERLTLADIVPPPVPEADFPLQSIAFDVADRTAVDAAIADDVDCVFHLAAVVSGQAEAAFDDGMRVNLQGALNLFERARALPGRPVVVFASSLAVYGGAVAEPIGDQTILKPQTSYGAQKAIGELLLTDYTRKGFLDGRGLRLPTVSIRPGRPNAAASSFLSSIFREPLQGEEAVCPAPPETPVWISAPRNAVANLIHAAELAPDALGTDRCLGPPGLTATVGEMVEAMTRVAGAAPARRIRWARDPAIEAIVLGWKARFAPERARALGFVEDRSFEDNVRWFLEDDARFQ